MGEPIRLDLHTSSTSQRTSQAQAGIQHFTLLGSFDKEQRYVECRKQTNKQTREKTFTFVNEKNKNLDKNLDGQREGHHSHAIGHVR